MSNEYRRDYTDSQKAALGAKGRAVYIDGHWAFPVADRQDYDDAVQSVANTPGKNRGKVRKYLMGLARKNGWPIPSSWNSDGSTSRAELPDGLEWRLQKGQRETRTFSGDVEIRAEGGIPILVGMAATVNHTYAVGDPDRNGFYERIRPQAFEVALREDPDVSLVLNHGAAGSGLPLARTTAGNLELSASGRGLHVRAPVDVDDPDWQLVQTKMRSGVLKAMSFAFVCRSDDFDQESRTRTITGLSLHRGDVSLVVHPANDQAQAELVARSATTPAPARFTVDPTRLRRERLALLERRERVRQQLPEPRQGSLPDLTTPRKERLAALRGNSTRRSA